MTLVGFNPRWADFPDYIIGITKEIWEDRGIARLNQYYADDIVVRSPSSVVKGNKGVIAATMATLAEFPDRQLLAEDVIWSGSSETGDLLSSHRIMTVCTHAREGLYGLPSGKALRYRVIADCAAKDDQIYDEWLIRDQGAIVRQLGMEPKRYAADFIVQEGGPKQAAKPFAPADDMSGRYQGRGNTHSAGQRYAAILSAMMNADMAVIHREYDRAVQSELPGGITGHGRATVDQFWMNLRAALPDATFAVHHQIGREDAMMPPRAALRWSLTGRHSGCGAFGPPSGAEVHVMGLSHAEFGPWGLRREFVLYDETAIWKQILLATG